MQAYKGKGEILSLTGLRGLAAVLVVITHYWAWTRVTLLDALPASLAPWMEASGTGMAIFFTLSGYVIALSYGKWDWRGRPAFNLARLFAYRFARLYPAYLAFALMAILWSVPLHDFSSSEVQGYLLPHFLLWQTWWPAKFNGVLPSDGHFHVSWSLSVECALYLMFGLGAILAAALPPWRLKPVILAMLFFIATWELLGVAWSMRGTLMPSDWTDFDSYRWLFLFSPYAIALQFGIGVVAYKVSTSPLSEHLSKAASNAGGLGLLVVYVLGATGIWTGGAFKGGLLSALATGVLMVGASSNSITNRLLSGSGIVYIGTISYSLYLFHFVAPPIALHGRHFDAFTPTAAGFHAVNFVASFAIAVIFATGVYVLVEVPSRRWIRALADRLLGLRRPPSMADQQATPAD